MKNILGIAPSRAVLATAAGLAAFAASAQAQLVLSYEDTTSGNAIGSAFTGPYRINLQLFDMGSVYPSLGAPGTAAGFGQNGTGTQTVAGGISTLNGIQTAGATASVGGEDTWGIGRILTITDLAGSVVWSETNKNAQLTMMFYGEKDYYVNQLANGFQHINGVDLMVDVWYQSKADVGYTQYDPLQGSAGRTGANGYNTVTDGSLVFRAESTAGFLHAPGTLGGPDAEFLSVFNATSGGTGQAYLSVIGGTQAGEFDTNSFSAPFLAGVTADMQVNFTTDVLGATPVSDWLVRGNDPVTGNFQPIPEPSTYGMIGAGALLGLVAWRRRRASKTVAA